MTDMLDITPDVNLLRMFRAEHVDYVVLIAEGIDNAFDAGATSIAISFDNDEICLVDNGRGIVREKIRALFSPGAHVSGPHTKLGRFGIGIKAQAICAGDTLEVESVSADGRVIASANWRDVLKMGGRMWCIPAPRWLPTLVGTHTGTTIVVGDLRRAPVVAAQKIADDIALRFFPAIMSGRHITLNGQTIGALPEPEMTDVVEAEIVLSHGRGARLRAGFLKHATKINRVHIAYEHRVIMPQSTLGCGDFSGLTRMFARVQLTGPWRFERFKNSLTDLDEREELEDALHQSLLPILIKCSTETISARLDRFSLSINDMLPEDLRPSRPRPKTELPPTPVQKRKRKPRAPEYDRSDEADSGPTRKRKPKAQLLITFDGQAEQDGIGTFKLGSPHRVDLSKDHPYIRMILENRDEAFGAQTLYVIAIMLFHDGMRDQVEQKELEFESFGMRVANTLAVQEGGVMVRNPRGS